ncbi:MAG: hypothetical protein IJH03_05205, partial [Clostridia bacterium]|nr:hypothetical protein [Clostridia bacterium]
IGTTILYIGGSILVILAAVLLITKRQDLRSGDYQSPCPLLGRQLAAATARIAVRSNRAIP